MKSVERQDGWWIVDGPTGIDDMGPYTTKKEAEEDRQGVEKFIKSNKKLWES